MTRVARHGSLKTEVYRRLRNDILQGRYPNGTTLTEAQITLAMGVSRTPVREAISQLELDGLVQSTPNKSIVVQGFDASDILDLFDIRRQMESIAAARAAEYITEEQLKQLKNAYDREVHDTINCDNVELLQEMDNLFHELIFAGSGSKILRKILTSINIFTSHARTVSLATPGRSLKVLEEHGRIMTAIMNRDGESASRTMREHINNASANYLTASRKGDKTDDR